MRSKLLLLALFSSALAAAQVSPYTGQSAVQPDSTGRYRLLIGGHFHGASTNASGFPAATVLANIDAINATEANVLLSTGDLFLQPDKDSARYTSSLFQRLKLPLFNAPGNHDLEGRAYRTPMPQRIDMGKDRIILLDTERDNSDIKGDQLALLEDLTTEVGTIKPEHVFIVTHRPVWAEDDPRYSALFSGNTRSLTGNNYKRDVWPLIKRMAANTQVFWISGSMAGRAPASLFFQEHEPNITYIQCAIRDQLRDAMLIADVDATGLTWRLWSLTGEETFPVTTYDAAWWEARQSKVEPFNWRRVPYLVKKNLSSPVFWYGASAALLLALAFSFVWRRTRRNR